MSVSFVNDLQKSNSFVAGNKANESGKAIDPVAQAKYMEQMGEGPGWNVSNANSNIAESNVEGGFTSRAWVWVEKLVTKVESNIENISEKIEEKSNTLISGVNSRGEELTERKRQNLTNKIEKLRGQLSEHLQVLEEIRVLSSSNQCYDVITEAGSSSSKKTGTAGFNFSTGVFEITMPGASSGIDLFAHELLHAYQFETGDYSVGPELSGDYKNLFYDKYDEVDAYARQGMYGSNEGVSGINSLPDEYDNVSETDANISNHPNMSAIATYPDEVQSAAFQNIAENTGHAFRVNGVTYYKKK